MSFVPIGLLFLRLMACLPRPVGRAVGRTLGRLLLRLAHSRRQVTRTNITLCFPEKSQSEIDAITRACFIYNGIGLIETAWAWYRPMETVLPEVRFSGLEHITARAEGQGILLLCPHYSMLDLVAPIIHQAVGRFVVTYRPNDNPTFDQAVCQGRQRYADLIDVRAMRETLKALKGGKVVWFGPDQDMGPKVSVFAPFFGHLACTVTTPSRLLSLTNARPVFLSLRRVADVYEAHFSSFPDGYPSDDLVADATLLNATIETAIRGAPTQYMWMHKRFKTNPDLSRQTRYLETEASESQPPQ